MLFRTTVHESLPYIDKEPTPAEREAAESLIQAELSSSSSDAEQPTLSSSAASYTPRFTPLMAAELDRVAAQQPLRAIDTSRYELPDDDDSHLGTSGSAPQLAPVLSRAYAAQTYLVARHAHLSLLDTYGKNAWLVGNWHLESELQALERDLGAARRDVDLVNLERRRAQDEVGEELTRLEKGWRDGVGRVLEAEVAVEGLRQRILEERRRLATGGAAVEGA